MIGNFLIGVVVTVGVFISLFFLKDIPLFTGRLNVPGLTKIGTVKNDYSVIDAWEINSRESHCVFVVTSNTAMKNSFAQISCK